MKYCFIQDNDYHWFMIPIKFKSDFYQWVESMEKCYRFAPKIDYEECMINCPSEYSVENPTLIDDI